MLTDKQEETLQAIKELIYADGYSPTIREIADRRGISIKAAVDSINILEEKNVITRDRFKSRSIRILENELYNNESDNDN